MSRQLSPRARLPLFALAVLVAAAVLALPFLLGPVPRGHHAQRRAPAAPPPLVTDGSRSADDPQPERAPLGAVRVGRRFLRLYVRLQTTPPDAAARRALRSLSSLALAHTLLAQPPQPAGGSRARGQLANVRVEPQSSNDVRLHATIRKGSSLLRVRCLVQPDQGRWTVTALTAVR